MGPEQGTVGGVLPLRAASRVDSFLLSDEAAQFEFDLRDGNNNSNLLRADSMVLLGAGGRDEAASEANIFGKARRFLRRLSHFGRGRQVDFNREDSRIGARSSPNASTRPGANYRMNVADLNSPFPTSSSCGNFLDGGSSTASPSPLNSRRLRRASDAVLPSMSTPHFKVVSPAKGSGDFSPQKSSAERGGRGGLRRRSLSVFLHRISPSFLSSERRAASAASEKRGKLSVSYDRIRSPPSRWSSLEDDGDLLDRGRTSVRMTKSERDLPSKRRSGSAGSFKWMRSRSKSSQRISHASQRNLASSLASAETVDEAGVCAGRERTGALCGVASIWGARHRRRERENRAPSSVSSESCVNVSRRSSSVSTDSFEGYLFEGTRRQRREIPAASTTMPFLDNTPPIKGLPPPPKSVPNLSLVGDASHPQYQVAADHLRGEGGFSPPPLYEVPHSSTRLLLMGKGRRRADGEEETCSVPRNMIITNARAFMNMLKKEKDCGQKSLSREKIPVPT